MQANEPKIKELANAKTLSDGVVGESPAANNSFTLYRELRSMTTSVQKSQLEWLRAKGSPAGRIYGAILLYELFAEPVSEAFKPLLADEADVIYQSGCDCIYVTVAEVATQLVSNQRYANFDISVVQDGAASSQN